MTVGELKDCLTGLDDDIVVWMNYPDCPCRSLQEMEWKWVKIDEDKRRIILSGD